MSERVDRTDLLHTMTPVIELCEGDYVDLEGDQYADPNSDPHGLYAFEYAVVQGWEQETPETVLVHFDQTSVGFPTRHKVRVRKEPT